MAFEKALTELTSLEEMVARLSLPDELDRRCSAGSGGKLTCKRLLTIGAGNPGILERGFADRIGRSRVARFTVSFVGEAEIPENAKGYLATVRKSKEPKNETTWKLSASTGDLREPELSGKDEAGNDLHLTRSSRWRAGGRSGEDLSRAHEQALLGRGLRRSEPLAPHARVGVVRPA
ncbi:MAG: hypothetical protein MI919_02545 [Holophagales bacterium]|nr:hypothetical protein [Holophagales bacterium]